MTNIKYISAIAWAIGGVFWMLSGHYTEALLSAILFELVVQRHV